MVNSGLMVNSTKFLSRFKIDFIGIKHWGVDCFAIQAKRSPPTLSKPSMEARVPYWALVSGGKARRSAKESYPSTFQDSSYANPHAPRPAGQTWWSTRASPGSRDADATRAPVWDWQLRDLATSTVTFVFCEPTFFTRTDAPDSRRAA